MTSLAAADQPLFAIQKTAAKVSFQILPDVVTVDGAATGVVLGQRHVAGVVANLEDVEGYRIEVAETLRHHLLAVDVADNLEVLGNRDYGEAYSI